MKTLSSTLLWGLTLLVGCGNENVSSTVEQSADSASREIVSASKEGVDSASKPPEISNEFGSCLQLVEACDGSPFCAVRCCDDTWGRERKRCGECRSYADNVCAGHGGPKRIRWER